MIPPQSTVISGIAVAYFGMQNISPVTMTGMTGIEIGTKIGIGTGIEMTTETEGTHGETDRIWSLTS